MADEGVFTKNADIQARAGVNANATEKLTAATDVYVLNIEAIINTRTRFDWSAQFTAGMKASTKGILTDVGASMCATIVIMADMSGFTSLEEARLMLNVLNNKINLGLSILKEKAAETFLLKT